MCVRVAGENGIIQCNTRLAIRRRACCKTKEMANSRFISSNVLIHLSIHPYIYIYLSSLCPF